MPAEFPRILAAWKRRDQSQWEIGDEIIKVAGKPGTPGVNNDTLARIKAELEAGGFDCPIDTLSDYQRIAAAFKAPDRSGALNWTVHRIAGEPDKLSQIIAAAGDRRLTTALARSIKRQIETANDTAAAVPATPTAAAPTTASVTGGGSGAASPTGTTPDTGDDDDDETPLSQQLRDVEAMIDSIAEDWQSYAPIRDDIRRGIKALRTALDRLEDIIDSRDQKRITR